MTLSYVFLQALYHISTLWKCWKVVMLYSSVRTRDALLVRARAWCFSRTYAAERASVSPLSRLFKGTWKPWGPRLVLPDVGLGVVDAVAGVVHGDLAGRELDAGHLAWLYLYKRENFFRHLSTLYLKLSLLATSLWYFCSRFNWTNADAIYKYITFEYYSQGKPNTKTALFTCKALPNIVSEKFLG